ncbi:MAG: Na(+)/H(+) antiporter NhaA [Nitrospinaceae bacterium]|nr:MAG: Na(+)/H(+) antiporter NhaA [Nitrospinaceae bacterium]
MVLKALREFLRLESASGLLLALAATLAMIAENTPLQPLYGALLNTPVAIRIGEFEIAKPLLLWINDGLMAIFFFLVGLEIKREILQGELSDPSRITLPAVAAVGGMAVPAFIYASLNWDNPVALEGWAIPSATDIAFALGVLSLLGKRVPHALKLFLLTLAIMDDFGAIIIIAIFYTSKLSLSSLLTAAVLIGILFLFNRKGVQSIASYLLVGAVLWAAVLKSGVHATLAGVLLAAFIPLRDSTPLVPSPLERLEEDLHPTVAYVILPLFAFANTGISLEGLSLSSLTAPVPLGIALGLVLGKQLGVFGFSWVAVKCGLAKLPKKVNWLQLYGVSALCGIGFTMSLFISSLAFEEGNLESVAGDRLGILTGSILSALFGYAILRTAIKRKKSRTNPR